jgi:hypothetical protein
MLAAIALIAASATLLLTFGARPAHSAALRSCVLLPAEQDPPGAKPTYNLGLKQLRTPCPTAKKVMKAFHACRSAKGYTCKRKVLTRWTCTGRKSSSTALIFYATYSCKSGLRRVTGSYQQNT